MLQTMKRCTKTMLILAIGALGAGAAAETPEFSFDYRESLPDAPARVGLTDPGAPTPEGWPNPCAAWADSRILAALDDRLQNIHPRHTWLEAPQFLNWAVWAYLSPDSRHHGEARLIPMIRQWLKNRINLARTPPEDEEARAKWTAGDLGGAWSFHDWTIPALELAANPALAAEVGDELVADWRALVIANIEHRSAPPAWQTQFDNLKEIPNFATHVFPIFIHGWVLTGERRYLEMAATIIARLDDIIQPDGCFPYLGWRGGRMSEHMYYRAINLRALYLYWWHTQSELAADIFHRTVPQYPLRMQPPYYWEDHAAIWWKATWRTFWPQHIAMVAAVARDGENARIAWNMAEDNVSADRFDLVLGSHAYWLMARHEVAPNEWRDRYIVPDRDVGGLRGRFGEFGFNFTVNSYAHTLAGAIVTDPENQRRRAALHLARPYVRVAAFDQAYRTDPNYSCLGRVPPEHRTVISGDWAAAATVYVPFDQATTWRGIHQSAPWRMAQLWFYTPDGMVGLMAGTATLDHYARELCQEYRFILPGNDDQLDALGEDRWRAGLLELEVISSDLPHRIVERERRNSLSAGQRLDWQLTLSDSARSPAQFAQDDDVPAAEKVLPEPRLYPAGHHAAALVRLRPTFRDGVAAVRLVSPRHVLAFTGEWGVKSFLVAYHTGHQDGGGDWQAPLPAGVKVRVHRSWDRDPAAGEEKTVADDGLPLHLPREGLVVITWAP